MSFPQFKCTRTPMRGFWQMPSPASTAALYASMVETVMMVSVGVLRRRGELVSVS
jgi:hypothetical protein